MNSESTPPSHTPLHGLHLELGGKMVDFAGWHMPVQYSSGIMAEHKQCRERAAWFDVSHMGQVELRGDDVARKLEALVPADIQNLPEGKARYTFFTNDSGGIMDDLIVTNAGDHLFVVVNASMRFQDIPHLRDNLSGVEVTERLDQALIALQGPAAAAIVAQHCPAADELTFMQSAQSTLFGNQCRISRLGYTGEDGFEISLPADQVESVSRQLLEHELCEPAGLGARDSLRLESGLCLYGNDIDNTTSPIEASLLWAIQKRRREEGGFPGADIIKDHIANGTGRKLVGLKPIGRVPARQGAEVLNEAGESVGKVTSGCFGPTIGGPVAMGYVSTACSAEGTKVNLSIRGKTHPATVAALPFIVQNYKR
ncbi:glycine cleavage system protein T [Chromatiales bacterium (ex Bugula neritina AB1)]|nr:glycine cleavage system protein T [Chromatiales bacterium (ex Bugula neritina AB1)]